MAMASMTGASQMPPPPPPLGRGDSLLSSSIPKSSADKSAKPSGPRRFHRKRSRGACEVNSVGYKQELKRQSRYLSVAEANHFFYQACRSRRIRCDAMTLGMPCTNCTAFSIECVVLTGRTGNKNSKEKEESKASSKERSSREKESDFHPMQLLEQQLMQDTIDLNLYVKFMDPEYRHAQVDPGKVGYVAEKSNLALLVGEDTVHYPIPGNVKDSRAKLAKLGQEEIDLLRQRGALSLPHWTCCDDLIEAYFRYVAPAVPIINRSRFMRQYRDPKNPPSLLLLQTIFLAGSRVTSKTYPNETGGATMPCSMTFYKRAKALYDSDYENDRIIVLQALILLGWYSEETGDVTKNVFYWNGLAATVAQGSGIHRSAEKARLPTSDKRLWKRIWWTLFTRDRSVAITLGRPVQINTNDSDVEMICEDDFIDDEETHRSEYRPNPVHVQFFIRYVSLCEIMSLVLSQQQSNNDEHSSNTLEQCDKALLRWLQNCPEDIKWVQSKYNFWAASLHCAYSITVILRHRAYLPQLLSDDDAQAKGYFEGHSYPLPFIAFQAACEITSAVQSMIHVNEIQYSPAFMIFALESALSLHIYQMHSEVVFIDTTPQLRIQTCMKGLEKLSRVWVAAKIVHSRFEAILCNTGFLRNSKDALELPPNGRQSAGDATASKASSEYDPMGPAFDTAHTVPPEFCDHVRQMIPDPTGGMFVQNSSSLVTAVPSNFQTMNFLISAGSASFDVSDPYRKSSYPTSIPSDMSLNPLLDPRMSLPESQKEATYSDYLHLFPQDASADQNSLGTFGPDDPGLSTMDTSQDTSESEVGSASQNITLPYSFSGYEALHGYIPVDPWGSG